MKRTITIIVLALIFTGTAYNQTSEAPVGAAGVEYWMSPRAVQAIWKKKGTLFQKYEKRYKRIGLLAYEDMMVGTEEFDLVAGKFLDDKLYEIHLSKHNHKEEHIEDVYRELQDLLMSIYPNGESFRNFESPYEDGDGRELEAIKLGKGTIVTYWIFQDSTIALLLEPLDTSVIVTIKYQHTVLATEAARTYNAVNDNEF